MCTKLAPFYLVVDWKINIQRTWDLMGTALQTDWWVKLNHFFWSTTSWIVVCSVNSKHLVGSSHSLRTVD